MRYRYVDHTSDLGVEIFGSDLPELFINGCFALFDNILNLTTVQEKETKSIALKSQTLEDLFMDWLRELLFIFATEYFIVKKITKINFTNNALTAELCGEKFDRKRHSIKIEIKTPTYHMFRIEQLEKGYKATVIFDV